METTNIKYDLLKKELELTQGQMDKYDHLSSSTKTWAVTLWVAIVGWTVQTDVRALVLIGVISTLIFWFFDGNNKKFREDYKTRRNQVAAVLELYSKNGVILETVSSPRLPSHENRDLSRNMFIIHVGLPYITLLVLSVALYFLI